MTKIKFAKIIILIVVGTVFNTNAQTKTNEDRLNILDYYKLIQFHDLDFERSKAKLKINDTKNGYLEFDVSNGKMKLELALFRKDNGKAIIVMFTQNDDIQDDPTLNSLKAFELSEFSIDQEKELENATNEVLPRLSSRENLAIFKRTRGKTNKTAVSINMIYKLPRKGNIISVTAINTEDEDDFESEVKLYELHLKNDKFVIVR